MTIIVVELHMLESLERKSCGKGLISNFVFEHCSYESYSSLLLPSAILQLYENFKSYLEFCSTSYSLQKGMHILKQCTNSSTFKRNDSLFLILLFCIIESYLKIRAAIAISKKKKKKKVSFVQNVK